MFAMAALPILAFDFPFRQDVASGRPVIGLSILRFLIEAQRRLAYLLHRTALFYAGAREIAAKC